MTLEEAIKYEEKVMVENLEKTKDRNASDPIAINCSECAEEHRQLAEWLKELKQLREQKGEQRMTYEPTSFKKIAIDYVKDKIPDNEFILMGSTDITEETKQSIDGQTTTKRITIEWLEWKENKE